MGVEMTIRDWAWKNLGFYAEIRILVHVGYEDGEGRAVIELAFKLDFGMQQMCQFHGDVQTKASATVGAGAEVFWAEELIENTFAVAFANADAGVWDLKQYAFLGWFRADGHTALFGIFDSIGNEIL